MQLWFGKDGGGMVVTVRPGQVGDADRLAPLAESAIRATYTPIAQAVVYEAVIAQTCTPEALAATIDAAQGGSSAWFLVAEDGAGPLGFLDFSGDAHALELRRLYTGVGQTGRGIGSLLLDALEARLPVGTQYDAVVHAANDRALTFWERHGFAVVGQVETRDHFAEHRGLQFESSADPEPSLVLRRTTDGRRGAEAPTTFPRERRGAEGDGGMS